MNDQEKKQWCADIYQQAADGGEVQYFTNNAWGSAIYGPTMCSNPEKWRIKPTLKVIDMSVMVGSGLDCEFWDTKSGTSRAYNKLSKIDTNRNFKNRDVNDTDWKYCQPRMSTEAQPFINFWTGGNTCPVPEGFEVRLHFRVGGGTMPDVPDRRWLYWDHTNNSGDIIGIEFLGIKDDYTLEQE
jgi:hypothetical protein